MLAQETHDYWNAYYASLGATRVPPSQFATFALGETADHDAVLDIGCGNGRDSMFFGLYGKRVLGVDGSEAAIAACEAQAAALGLAHVSFAVADVGTDALAGAAAAFLTAAQKPLIYARFFIHAIPEKDEVAMLAFVARHIGEGSMAVEFRTQRDEALNKVTPGHYRRFVDPIGFARRAGEAGLAVTYLAEGFGMAKYKADDAYVARLHLRSAK